MKTKALNYMFRSLGAGECTDSMGFINLTQLAENAAHEFNHDEWLDDESHWVWEVALDAEEKHRATI